jgi:hypothetical protein
MSITEVTDREMLIDRALARFDFTRVEHEVVEADPEATYAAVRRLDFMKVHSPLMDAAMWVRGVPDKVSRATGRGTEPPRELPSLTFDGMLVGEGALPGWMSLGEDQPREIAFGAIGKFWQLDITWLDPVPETLEAFTAFDDPDWGKIAANFSVRPYGEGRSLLSYEARTAMTDEASRTKFARYWTVVSPFVGVIMRATLHTVKADAEG